MAFQLTCSLAGYRTLPRSVFSDCRSRCSMRVALPQLWREADALEILCVWPQEAHRSVPCSLGSEPSEHDDVCSSLVARQPRAAWAWSFLCASSLFSFVFSRELHLFRGWDSGADLVLDPPFVDLLDVCPALGGGASIGEPACRCRRCRRLRFDPCVRKTPGQETAAHSRVLA